MLKMAVALFVIKTGIDDIREGPVMQEFLTWRVWISGNSSGIRPLVRILCGLGD
jgi:hypothetical protein